MSNELDFSKIQIEPRQGCDYCKAIYDPRTGHKCQGDELDSLRTQITQLQAEAIEQAAYSTNLKSSLKEYYHSLCCENSCDCEWIKNLIPPPGFGERIRALAVAGCL